MSQTLSPPKGRRAETRRLGVVYAIDTLQVDADGRALAFTEELGYVGQSRQDAKTRALEHRGLRPQRDGKIKPQSWSDLFLRVRELQKGEWTADELDKREQYWIRALKPRYNEKHNEGNPVRIRPIQARAQRDLRNRERASRAMWSRLLPAETRVALRRLADRAAAWTAVVLVLTFVLAIAGSWLPVPRGVWLVAAVGAVWVARRRPFRRR